MDLTTAITSRQSVRSYKPDSVPEESLGRILRAAQAAPSWKNRQAWHIIVVRDRAMIKTLGGLLDGNPHGVDYKTLPAMLVLAMEPGRVDVFDGKEYYLVDAGIVGEHIVLAATAEGLGTCWIGWFEDAPIKAALSIPDNYRVVMLTPLGFPAKETKVVPRKALSEFVHQETW